MSGPPSDGDTMAGRGATSVAVAPSYSTGRSTGVCRSGLPSETLLPSGPSRRRRVTKRQRRRRLAPRGDPGPHGLRRRRFPLLPSLLLPLSLPFSSPLLPSPPPRRRRRARRFWGVGCGRVGRRVPGMEASGGRRRRVTERRRRLPTDPGHPRRDGLGEIGGGWGLGRERRAVERVPERLAAAPPSLL